jgi:hypothetical protein
MARMYLLEFPAQPLILSVEDSVGRGGANRRLDVMLVQFFLNASLRDEDKSWAYLTKTKLNSPTRGRVDYAISASSRGDMMVVDRGKFSKPNIDGVYGPQTQFWIDRFQEFVNLGHPLVVDGRVDPILDGLAETSQHTVFTMYSLNVAYYEYSGAGAVAISRVARDPLMPRELARTFTMHRLSGEFIQKRPPS